MKRISILGILLLCHIMAFASCNGNPTESNNEIVTEQNQRVMTKITIKIGDKIAKGVLYDNPSAKSFQSQLPLTLEMEDYNRTEKISTLPKKLSTDQAPKGFDPNVGDLCYYAPWGNMCLFYKDFGYSTGLVSLGKITEGLEHFQQNGNFKVTIEIAE